MDAYQALFQSGHHSSEWKEAIGIIISKRNKKDYTTPKAYKPISLLPCISKLLEKILAIRLSFLANTSNDLLDPSQVGGRKQRSAIYAALLLQAFIGDNHVKKMITCIP